jgi:hypothetical protein
MPPAEDYREAVAKTRAEVVGQEGVQAQTVAEMRRALAAMLADLQSDIEAGTLTPERAQRLRESIDAALQRFRDRAVVVLEEGRRAAIQAAVQGHTAGLSAIAEQASQAAGTISVAESFTEVPETVLQIGMDRRAIGGAETMQTLVNRSVQEAADDIDDAIESAIGRGVDNQRLATDIATELARGDDALQKLVRDEGGDIDPDADPMAIDEGDLDRAKRLEYDARRIAVSEVNSHYHEADVISAIQSPVVDLLRWRTSELHTREKRYVPDICDVLESQDLFGYGGGLYHPAAAPSLVHPFCQCRYESVLKEPKDYGEPNRPLPEERKFSATSLEEVMKEMEGERSITEKYAQRQAEAANEHLAAAFKAGRKILNN